MLSLNQKGIAHLFLPVILLLGLIAGVYLVTSGTLKLSPKAGGLRPTTPETSFTLIGPNGCAAGFFCTMMFQQDPKIGDKFDVKLYVRSDLEAANLFTAKLTFPKDIVEVSEIKTDNSFVKNWVESYYDNETGTISLVGGVPDPGYQTKTGEESALMAIITLKAKAEGKALISVIDDSAIYSNLNNINILTKKSPFEITVASSVELPPSEPPVATGGFETGLEAGEQHDISRVDLVAESGAKWVRLNFVGSDWSAGSADVKSYNAIIDAYVKQGLKIIGLIGAQSVAGGYNRNDQASFAQKYVDTTDAIIARFGDRVKTYELFNEPNDWAGGNSAQLSEKYFATYLSEIYRKIKIDEKKTNISLISGPLFSFDLNNGASYLYNTYTEGKDLSGADNWETIKQQTGSYPLDGVGYHIYVAQGMGDRPQVENKIKENLNAIEDVIKNMDTDKKVWISEFGWGTGKDRVTEEVQAVNLEKSFNIFKNDPMVRMAMWFTLSDFNSEQWGVLKQDGVKKIAWPAFQRINGQSCPANLSYTCVTGDKHKLNVVWSLENKYGGNSCNVYIRDNRGDHQINGSNYAGLCAGSVSMDSLDGNPIFDGGHYQMFASNGDPAGGCYNQQKGDVTLNCNAFTSLGNINKGDINGDGKIALNDMSALFSAWNKTGKADLNTDGIVNTIDYSMMRNILSDNKVIRK